MMIIKQELWLCDDCTIAAVNDDYTGFSSDEQIEASQKGLATLGQHLSANFDSETDDGIREFSNCGCDCCRSKLAGRFHRFAILGEISTG